MLTSRDIRPPCRLIHHNTIKNFIVAAADSQGNFFSALPWQGAAATSTNNWSGRRRPGSISHLHTPVDWGGLNVFYKAVVNNVRALAGEVSSSEGNNINDLTAINPSGENACQAELKPGSILRLSFERCGALLYPQLPNC